MFYIKFYGCFDVSWICMYAYIYQIIDIFIFRKQLAGLFLIPNFEIPTSAEAKIPCLSIPFRFY